MTLIEALDELRFADLAVPMAAPSMLRQVEQWWRERPDDLHALYDAAGMPRPLDRTALTITQVIEAPVPRRLQPRKPPRIYDDHSQRAVRQVLEEGVPVSFREIADRLGMTRMNVNSLMFRLRKRHVPILKTSGGREPKFYMRKDDDRCDDTSSSSAPASGSSSESRPTLPTMHQR